MVCPCIEASLALSDHCVGVHRNTGQFTLAFSRSSSIHNVQVDSIGAVEGAWGSVAVELGKDPQECVALVPLVTFLGG